VKTEVEKRLRLERAAFDRQRAEYEQQISRLEARCAELTSEKVFEQYFLLNLTKTIVCSC